MYVMERAARFDPREELRIGITCTPVSYHSNPYSITKNTSLLSILLLYQMAFRVENIGLIETSYGTVHSNGTVGCGPYRAGGFLEIPIPYRSVP